MTYQLYRTDEPDATSARARLGAFADFDTALAARDRDVIAQLRAAPSPPREISHLIVGPGPHGPHTEHPLVTYAGIDVTDPDPTAQIDDVDAWLHALRAR